MNNGVVVLTALLTIFDPIIIDAYGLFVLVRREVLRIRTVVKKGVRFN